jgi:3'(2'), 5'-bisphosphate nucleotidase
MISAISDGIGADDVLSGSVGVKCSLIAEGEADVYVHPVPFLKEWDTCAPETVLRGAGGRVTDCAGEALTYGKEKPAQPRGIFAGRADVWARALPLVREVTAVKLGFAS